MSTSENSEPANKSPSRQLASVDSKSALTAKSVSVRTLLCHRDLSLALRCLRTLVECCRDPVEIVIHEDGSLTPEDEAQLSAALPLMRVIRRATADALMAERLAGHPHARAFRAGSVWGLKLLDVALLESGDCYYVDGDIRFFRPFEGLFHPSAIAGKSVFLRDTVWTAYSIRPWHLMDGRGLKVVEGINTGLTLIDRGLYDLDFVNWFLSQPDWRVIPAWTEPTCWAALAIRANGHAVDPRQLTNLYPRASITDQVIGAHFLSAYRRSFQEALHCPVVTNAPVHKVRIQALNQIGPSSLGLNQLKRKLGNEWERLRRSI